MLPAFLCRVWLALCAAALLCPPASAGGHLSQDPAVTQARGLIHAGRHRAALDILRPLADPARADPTEIRAAPAPPPPLMAPRP